MRKNNRKNNELRPIKFTKDFTKHALGSVLVEFGDTKVITTASVDHKKPKWMEQDDNRGWVTAEYSLLPSATNTRCSRERNKVSGAFLAMMEQKSFSGPLPAPEDFMAYKEVLPDAPERILTMAEHQLSHRINMEAKIVDAGINESKRGQNLGAILAVLCLISAIYLGINGHDWLAGSIMTIIVGIVGVFVLRKEPSKKDKESDDDIES